jgi:hypothetical protein
MGLNRSYKQYSKEFKEEAVAVIRATRLLKPLDH